MGPAIWLSMARDDLRAAELLAENGITPLSYLHADQAIEKALWALRLHREGPGGEASDSGAEEAASARRPLSNHPSSGTERRGIASALASLTAPPAHRPPAGEKAEAELAREAVQAAHQVIDRITEQVYGDVRR
jgi:HEPN domain-containing protein